MVPAQLGSLHAVTASLHSDPIKIMFVGVFINAGTFLKYPVSVKASCCSPHASSLCASHLQSPWLASGAAPQLPAMPWPRSGRAWEGRCVPKQETACWAVCWQSILSCPTPSVTTIHPLLSFLLSCMDQVPLGHSQVEISPEEDPLWSAHFPGALRSVSKPLWGPFR